MKKNICACSAPFQQFDQNQNRIEENSEDINCDIMGVALQTLEQKILNYELSDHFKPRRWFNLIAKAIIYFKDLVFILGQKGEIQDYQRHNKELRSKLIFVGREIDTISHFQIERGLLRPKEISNDQKIANWPDFLAGSDLREKLHLLRASKSLIENSIDLNERKIAHAKLSIKRRKLDPQTGSLMQKIKRAWNEKERLEANIDLAPCYEIRAAKNRFLQRQIEESPDKLIAVVGKIRQLQKELIGLLNQYEYVGQALEKPH